VVVGVGVGRNEIVGKYVPSSVGAEVANCEGEKVGTSEASSSEGESVGSGSSDGAKVGNNWSEGANEGSNVGVYVGFRVGSSVGDDVVSPYGSTVTCDEVALSSSYAPDDDPTLCSVEVKDPSLTASTSVEDRDE